MVCSARHLPRVTVPEPLTAAQRRVYDAIASSLERRGYPPTVREIAVAIGSSSTNNVMELLRRLHRKGAIVLGPKGSGRTIQLAKGYVWIPVLLDAERPHEVIDTVKRPSFAPGASYAVVMRDDSLKARGILRGDWLFVDTAAPREEAGRVVIKSRDGAVIGVVVGMWRREIKPAA